MKVDSNALRKRPELAAHIAVICSMWTEVEEQLTWLFVVGMRTEPAIAAATLGHVFNITTRLDMIETALSLRFPPDALAPFEKIAKGVKARARERNNVVHGMWTIHDDHPDGLIRLSGITDPTLEIQKYTERDFLEIQIRLVQQCIDLKQFFESLTALPWDRSPEQPERFWRPSEPSPGGGGHKLRRPRPGSPKGGQSRPSRPVAE